MTSPIGYLYHHIGLYGYPLAWAAGSAIASKPTFRHDDRVPETPATAHCARARSGSLLLFLCISSV